MSFEEETEDLGAKSGRILLGIVFLILILAGVQSVKKSEQGSEIADSDQEVEYQYYASETDEEIKEDEVAAVTEEVEEVEAIEEVVEIIEEEVEEVALELEEEKDSAFKSKIVEGFYEEKKEVLSDIEEETQEKIVTDLQNCQLEQIGVQFLCDPAWDVVPYAGGIDRIIVQEQPLIALGIDKLDKKYRFLAQLNSLAFEKMGFYKDGFKTERVSFAGHEAVLVKAYSALKDSTQRRDYFYIYEGNTVHISFSLEDEEWAKGDQNYLKVITDSFQKM